MSDLDEFYKIVGTEAQAITNVCPQKGCNKQRAVSDDKLQARLTEAETARCTHCYCLYVPGDHDRSPAIIKRGKESREGREWDVEYFEDGSKRYIFKLPK